MCPYIFLARNDLQCHRLKVVSRYKRTSGGKRLFASWDYFLNLLQNTGNSSDENWCAAMISRVFWCAAAKKSSKTCVPNQIESYVRQKHVRARMSAKDNRTRENLYKQLRSE